jgi:formate-dependent nitrite reductase cytochrome c552 subunit
LRKACPIAKANCVSCHMPKVELPNGLITFTDHQIRVVRPGDPYPN